MSATLEEVARFVAESFPQSQCRIDSLGSCRATVSRGMGPDDLRPGGTVSGFTLMAVADVALYVAILGEIGIVPLAVTTNLSINFLRKPEATSRIIGQCELMKVGRALAVGEVALYAHDSDKMIAHATGTYSIPPKRKT